jgi:hypothetical protein
MAQKPYRRGDDRRPGSGFRLVLPDGRVEYLAPDEKAGAAQVAQAQQALGASPEEISDAVIRWLQLRRKSKNFIQGDE